MPAVPFVRAAGSPDLLARIRAACVAAHQQRELVERILMALLGDLGTENGRARVLIVDDAEDNRELAATVLENSGFHTITAANGLEGVIAAHCLRPVAILMDVTMPVLDGIEAARLLKASAVTRSLNVRSGRDTRAVDPRTGDVDVCIFSPLSPLPLVLQTGE